MTHNYPHKQQTSQLDEPVMVVAESETFVAFDLWMDGQLADLVARWEHTAAPNAERAGLLSRRISQ